ncbi:hypothetical protein T03_10340 [Trichinella britovi]|uniref:Apple domain-containing protein n=1 Tax=Trichinella britovi TaxID=45882 RepID=A0A0V1CQV4_TRIBR|nr:hypothetical protein T03_10340 [Trichinella britovi]
MLKQWSLLAIICFIKCNLVNCSWMSLYIPKLDATCVLSAKAIIHDDVLHIKQVHCTIESCVATCFGLSPFCNLIKYSPFAKLCNLYYENATHHDLQPNEQIGQSMHLLLHSCHQDITDIPVGILVQSKYQRNNAAKIHTPSIHKNCDFCRLPFVENFHAQRIQLIATSSLKRCFAFCEAPTHTSCNSVLFSAQEGTCLLLSRARNLTLFGGIMPTLQSSALFFIILRCYNDGMLISIVKDIRMLPLKHSNHITTEAKVSLFQFKEICTVQHSLSTVIPWINLVQLYANISFLNDCISICRFIRNFGLCEGIAYSKESKACLIAVLGNNDDEVYLNEGYHFLTLNDCSKDRENERADNDPPELHVFPILDEVCQLEFYKPLFLTGWSVITEIQSTTTLQNAYQTVQKLCEQRTAVLFTS